jgi:hypothetical protein
MMNQITSAALALAMLSAFVLVLFGFKLARVRETRTRGLLMIVAAAVLVTNVMIATM